MIEKFGLRRAEVSPTTLEEATKAYAEAKRATETGVFNGDQSGLNDAKEAFIHFFVEESMASRFNGIDMSDPYLLGDIALEALGAINELNRQSDEAYENMLENRNGFQLGMARIGGFFSSSSEVKVGKAKIPKWINNPIVKNTALGLGLGLGGIAWPVTVGVAGAKVWAQKQVLLEEGKDQDREIKSEDGSSTLDYIEFEDDIRDEFDSRPLGRKDTKDAVEWAIQQLADQSEQASKDRQRELRAKLAKKAGTMAVGMGVGYGVGQAIGHASGVIDGVKGLFGNDSPADLLRDATPSAAASPAVGTTEVPDIATTVPTETADIATATADPTGTPEAPVATATAAPTETATAEPTATATVSPTAGATGTEAAATSTAEAQPPMAGAQGGEAVGTPPADTVDDSDAGTQSGHEAPAGDGELKVETEGDDSQGAEKTETDSNSTASEANEPSSADEGFIGPELIEDVDPGVSIEDLTAEVAVGEGDGVTQVLRTVLAENGYSDVSPAELFEIYQGLADPESGVGPHNIFKGVELYWEPDAGVAGEWWIAAGNGNLEASLTPEAAAWVHENSLPSFEADSPAIEPIADGGDPHAIQSDKAIADGTGGAEYNVEAVDVAETVPSPDSLTDATAVNDGEGVTYLLSRIVEDAGYGEVTPGQSLAAYNGLIDQVGPNGVFEGVQLEASPTGDEYWMPDGVTEVQLTPEASAWIEHNISNIQNGVEIEPDATGPEGPLEYRGEAADTIEQVPDTADTDPNAIQSNAVIGDGTGAADYSVEATDPDIGTIEAIDETDSIEAVEPTGAITINQGEGVTQVLDTYLAGEAGYENVTPNQLFAVYQGLVNDPAIGAEGVFTNVTLEWDEVAQQYWIPSDNFVDGTLTTDLTPQAAAWIESNFPEIQASEPQMIESAGEPQDIEPIREGVIAPDNVVNLADYQQDAGFDQKVA